MLLLFIYQALLNRKLSSRREFKPQEKMLKYKSKIPDIPDFLLCFTFRKCFVCKILKKTQVMTSNIKKLHLHNLM